MSCVTSQSSECGSPSGIVSNRKSSTTSREDMVRPALIRRRWLYSVLMKVMKKPLWWRILASLSMGVIWPWAGKGTHTAWGLCLSSMELISSFAHCLIRDVWKFWSVESLHEECENITSQTITSLEMDPSNGDVVLAVFFE